MSKNGLQLLRGWRAPNGAKNPNLPHSVFVRMIRERGISKENTGSPSSPPTAPDLGLDQSLNLNVRLDVLPNSTERPVAWHALCRLTADMFQLPRLATSASPFPVPFLEPCADTNWHRWLQVQKRVHSSNVTPRDTHKRDPPSPPAKQGQHENDRKAARTATTAKVGIRLLVLDFLGFTGSGVQVLWALSGLQVLKVSGLRVLSGLWVLRIQGL